MRKQCSFVFFCSALTLLLLGVSLTHTSCDGDDGKDPYELGPYYMGEWLWYVYFKEGSQWVYESSFEGETRYDTVVVTSSRIDTTLFDDGESGHWKVTKENFALEFSSSHQGFTIHKSSTPRLLDAVDTNSYSRFSMERIVWDEGSIRPFFRYTRNYKEAWDGAGFTKFEGKLEKLEIDARTYSDILVFYIESDGTWSFNGNPARYYWSKNIGLIKRENLRTGEEWHLVDYDVMQ